MIDHWAGQLFSALTVPRLWDSTAVIVCTDHGHYLGEKDIWGKPGVMQYEPLGHTPLLVALARGWRGDSARHALTTNVDIHTTIADVFGVATPRGSVTPHGVPRWPHSPSTKRRRPQTASGLSEVSTATGSRSPTGAPSTPEGPEGENFPLSMWSNRWSTMPVHGLEDQVRLPPPDRRARLDFMPDSEVPVIRQPFEPGDRIPFWVGHNAVDRHFLFDLEDGSG